MQDAPAPPLGLAVEWIEVGREVGSSIQSEPGDEKVELSPVR